MLLCKIRSEFVLVSHLYGLWYVDIEASISEISCTGHLGFLVKVDLDAC